MRLNEVDTMTRKKLLYIVMCLMLVCMTGSFGGAFVFADEEEPDPVRIGYYENEVFQEGAKEGAVKTGYAYEYYRKLSEYTGWKYEYVYGGFNDLYQMDKAVRISGCHHGERSVLSREAGR